MERPKGVFFLCGKIFTKFYKSGLTKGQIMDIMTNIDSLRTGNRSRRNDNRTLKNTGNSHNQQ